MTSENQNSVDFFEKTMITDKNDYNAWNKLAIANIIAKQRIKAIACWKKSLKIKKNQIDTLNNLSTALVEEGCIEEALKYYQQAVNLSPNYALGWKNLGRTLVTAKKYNKGIKALTTALTHNPNDQEILIFLAQASYSIGDWKKALENLHLILQNDGENDLAYYNKACIHAILEQHDEACQNLDKAIKRNNQWLRKANLDPDFDKIRSTIKFQNLVKESNLF